MPATRDELTQEFRGQYGRLMVLVAAALNQGHDQSHVLEATRGEGNRVAPVYVNIRRQRDRVEASLKECGEAGASTGDIVRVGQEAKAAVEGEYMFQIPLAGWA